MYKEKLTMLCCGGIIGISKKWSSDLLGERKVCEIVIRAVVSFQKIKIRNGPQCTVARMVERPFQGRKIFKTGSWRSCCFGLQNWGKLQRQVDPYHYNGSGDGCFIPFLPCRSSTVDKKSGGNPSRKQRCTLHTR